MEHIKTPTRTQADAATNTRMKRRGLIAGAAALAASLLARQSPQPVGAADGDKLTLGIVGDRTNQATTTTTLNSTAVVAMQVTSAVDGTALKGVANGANASTVEGVTDLGEGVLGMVIGGASGGTGVHGRGSNPSSTGVYGESVGDSGTGVYGLAEVANSTGIYGDVYLDNSLGVGGNVRPGGTLSTAVYGVNSGTNGLGVRGSSFDPTSIGVLGDSTGYVGVWGNSDVSFGVLGASRSGYGLSGVSTSAVGTFGFSSSNVGVQGQSLTDHGTTGVTDSTDGHAALFGFANKPGGIGLIAQAQPSVPGNGTAGIFLGDVNIYGNYTATGTKTAAVKQPDGSYRLLYCVEATEAWFEDFGEGTLANGKATVAIDPEFAAVVDTSKMHVFITEYGAANQLAVSKPDKNGFTVEATAAATGPKRATPAGGTFSYRIVGKRKDVAAPRLAKVNLASAVAATSPVPAPPKVPALPKRPNLPARPRAIKQK